MHGPVPQASPPQPQVSHSITSDGTPSMARSAATLLQPHSERGVEPTHSSWIHALPGTQGVRVSSSRCVPAARAGCGAATNSRHAFWDIFDAFGPYTRTTCLIAPHGRIAARNLRRVCVTRKDFLLAPPSTRCVGAFCPRHVGYFYVDKLGLARLAAVLAFASFRVYWRSRLLRE